LKAAGFLDLMRRYATRERLVDLIPALKGRAKLISSLRDASSDAEELGFGEKQMIAISGRILQRARGNSKI